MSSMQNRIQMWIHLHILHRMRRLGAITGVLGDESLGEQGRLANMLSDGKVPSPSVKLIVNVHSRWLPHGVGQWGNPYSSFPRLFFPYRTSVSICPCE